jgi:hypothetical protein
MSTSQAVSRAVTIIMGVVIGLTFLFGFGNVLHLALRLGVSVWVAPLIAPSVDLSVLGLVLAVHHLALHGFSSQQLRPARRLLMFCSVATLALNVAEPLVGGQFGTAAVDAVGPVLLIGWAEVSPSLLAAITTGTASRGTDCGPRTVSTTGMGVDAGQERVVVVREEPSVQGSAVPVDELLQRARLEDRRHREACARPISAETLRRRLRIGSARSRSLVTLLRSEACLELRAAGEVIKPAG